MKMPDVVPAAYPAPIAQPGVVSGGKANTSENGNHDFPTLLNIEWPAEASEDIVGEPLPDALIEEMPVESALADAEQHGKAAANIQDIITDNLLFNSQFNVSIQVLHADNMNSEASKLIDDFNRAVANTDEPLGNLPFAASAASIANAQRNGINAVPVNNLKNLKGLDDTKLPDAVGVVSNSVVKSGQGLGTPASAGAGPVQDTLQNGLVQAAKSNQAVNTAPQSEDVEIQSIKMDRSVAAKPSADHQVQFLSQVSVNAVPGIVARLSANPEGRLILAASGIDKAIPVNTTAGARTIEVQLVPKNLGVVELKVMKTDQGTHIAVRVETAEAERLLMSEKSSIYEAMRSVGVSVDDMKITLTPRSDPNGDMRFDKQGGSEFQEHLEAGTSQNDAGDNDQNSNMSHDSNDLEQEINNLLEDENKPVGLYF